MEYNQNNQLQCNVAQLHPKECKTRLHFGVSQFLNKVSFNGLHPARQASSEVILLIIKASP